MVSLTVTGLTRVTSAYSTAGAAGAAVMAGSTATWGVSAGAVSAGVVCAGMVPDCCTAAGVVLTAPWALASAGARLQAERVITARAGTSAATRIFWRVIECLLVRDPWDGATAFNHSEPERHLRDALRFGSRRAHKNDSRFRLARS